MLIKRYASADDSIVGFTFCCPGCKHHHAIRVKSPTGPVWSWNGSTTVPTFTPSIFVNPPHLNCDGIACHSFVTDGKIQFLGDCTHALAGQTVDLPHFPTDEED